MKTICLFSMMMLGLLNSYAKPIQSREVFLIIDVTDIELYQLIKKDIQINFSVFMQNTRFAEISSNQRFTLHTVSINGTESLEIKSASICIPQDGLSGQAQNQLRNPKPLIALLKAELIEYELISARKLHESSILSVLLKTMLQANTDAESWFFLFSDLIENNNYNDFYKRVPEPKDAKKYIMKSVDPLVLNKLSQRISDGFEPHIVLVQKESSTSKVDLRKLRVFWQSIISELGFSDIQIIDNLTNAIDK